MATLDDKILGEKRHYYCSSSSDEDDSDDDKDKGKDGSCATVTDADNGTLDQQQPRFFDSSGAVNVSSYLCPVFAKYSLAIGFKIKCFAPH